MLTPRTTRSRALEPCLPGYEAIHRAFDPSLGAVVARIRPGESYVTWTDELCTTTLGSCVSVCVRDPRSGLGGMNHFMLPHPRGDGHDSWLHGPDAAAARYGSYAIERLLNELIGRGVRRSALEVKLVGGGRMYATSADVGRQNIEFARAYFATEGIPVKAEDLGDDRPRMVRYQPATGRLLVKRLGSVDVPALRAAEQEYGESIDLGPAPGAVELF